jgi:hypothetical protein
MSRLITITPCLEEHQYHDKVHQAKLERTLDQHVQYLQLPQYDERPCKHKDIGYQNRIEYAKAFQPTKNNSKIQIVPNEKFNKKKLFMNFNLINFKKIKEIFYFCKK